MPPGLLYVTMQPGESLPASSFHDWYNNEHGPIRLRLPFIENGFRYRAIDLDDATKDLPEWLAIYDVADMQEMKREPYLRLRREDIKSPREKAVMAQIAIDRRLYDLVESTQSKGFTPLEQEFSSGARALMAVSYVIEVNKAQDFERWYRAEHMSRISNIHGWQRSRRFVTSSVEPKELTEHLFLHEFSLESDIGNVATELGNHSDFSATRETSRRVYRHFYTFGPAPRDLTSVASASSFTSPDGRTKALPAPSSPLSVPMIESYIMTSDGVDIPYRLDGSPHPSAPLIVLSNSILTHFSIWDGFLDEFFSKSGIDRQCRVLRYLTRGRFSNCGNNQITVDVLAADIIALLDALRVEKAAALIGVSLGGATVLNAALTYPDRVGAFVACDTNSKSPEGNRKAWGDRIAVAVKEGAVGPSGEPIVGDQLADMTVSRWFVKGNLDDGNKQDQIRQVSGMVRENSLVGFQKSVEALFEYDLRDKMKESAAQGAFLVGAGDGILPKTMKEMVDQMGPKAKVEFHVIDEAGHLPMVEQPRRFAQAVEDFLAHLPP